MEADLNVTGCHSPFSCGCSKAPPVANPEASTSIHVGHSGFQSTKIEALVKASLSDWNASFCTVPQDHLIFFLVGSLSGHAFLANPSINL